MLLAVVVPCASATPLPPSTGTLHGGKRPPPQQIGRTTTASHSKKEPSGGPRGGNRNPHLVSPNQHCTDENRDTLIVSDPFPSHCLLAATHLGPDLGNIWDKLKGFPQGHVHDATQRLSLVKQGPLVHWQNIGMAAAPVAIGRQGFTQGWSCIRSARKCAGKVYSFRDRFPPPHRCSKHKWETNSTFHTPRPLLVRGIVPNILIISYLFAKFHLFGTFLITPQAFVRLQHPKKLLNHSDAVAQRSVAAVDSLSILLPQLTKKQKIGLGAMKLSLSLSTGNASGSFDPSCPAPQVKLG